jgi:hypothetical protein
VDFGRLRKFGRADEEAGSHRAEAAPEWATSNTWDDQQEPEKRKGRRARKAEPEPEQPQPQQWPAEQATESQPAEKKSRRQQRRERKTRPDETEEWLSGLSSSEPMSWEARQGRTTPNDGLGLTEDMADFKRQPSRQRGSLFEDNGDETWNSPPPATDGDDWWEATPRRRRDGKDS